MLSMVDMLAVLQESHKFGQKDYKAYALSKPTCSAA